MANVMKKKTKIQEPFSDKVLDVITTLVLVAILIVVAYPVIYTVSCSFSNAEALNEGRVVLWPIKPDLNGYKYVLQFKQFYSGFGMSVFYTFFGTIITLVLKILMAYPISRPNFHARKTYTKILLATMLVNAGMIPLFIIKSKLGLYNNIWAFLITGSLGTSDIFILRTAFKSSVPGELYDAAAIDGASEFQMLWKIAVPLCKATISTITLYGIVAFWNNYFTPMIYLRKEELQPLSIFLRTLLNSSMINNPDDPRSNGIVQMKYAVIVVATVPVLAAYAVVQKYFKGGMMIGSVKG